MSRFRSPDEYASADGYRLLPFRFRRLPDPSLPVLLTNDVGEHLWMEDPQFHDYAGKRLPANHPQFADLESRHFLSRDDQPIPLESMALQLRSRKAFLFEGPALHIFVATLRCNHSCQYCQVSRRVEGESPRFDMSFETVTRAVGHVLASPAKQVTVEFQGGEPLLAFEVIRFAVEELERRNASIGKTLRYVITTVLQHLTPERLEFIRQHRIELSTSFDGPAGVHNANRPLPSRDSYQRTVAGLDQAREALGPHAVAALTTITKKSLSSPEAIIDSYRELGLHSVFLRPLSPYGFAAKSPQRDYSVAEFMAFYRKAIAHLIQVNLDGYAMDEAYAALLLRSILTPFSHGHVDLRSPAGAGLGTLVYNYDGKVYASDEARMLAAMGEETFCLGHVENSYAELMRSDAMQLIAAGGIAESIPGCSDCAYLPFCGSDPVDSYRRQGDVIGHRPTSDFCERQMGMFDLLFGYLHRGTEDQKRVLLSWVTRRRPVPLAVD